METRFIAHAQSSEIAGEVIDTPRPFRLEGKATHSQVEEDCASFP